MDIKKYNKPIHFTCPKCGADFEFNGGQIVKEREALKQEILVTNARMQAHKEEYGKDGYYKKLVRRHGELVARKHEIDIAYRQACEQGEQQLFIIFKKLVMKRLGKEETVKLLKEAEDDLSYNTYDSAIQNHNRFNGL